MQNFFRSLLISNKVVIEWLTVASIFIYGTLTDAFNTSVSSISFYLWVIGINKASRAEFNYVVAVFLFWVEFFSFSNN